MGKTTIKQINVPFLDPKTIADEADKFVTAYHPSLKPPIPIEEIAEFQLDIKVYPSGDLYPQHGIEGFINSNFNVLTIDQKIYEEKANRSRRRSTFAHEVAHIILHRDIFEGHDFNSKDEYLEFVDAIGERNIRLIEQQAYIFAGHVLVPSNLLDEQLGDAIKKAGGLSNMSLQDLTFIMEELKRSFQVSGEFLRHRITHQHPEVLKAAEKLYK